MKILHTSDWHLGKRLLGKDLTDYQREITAEIAEIAASKNVDVVAVAGDVFDSGTPSPEATGVFLEAVERITAGGERAMVVVAGGLDNPAVLKAYQSLSKRVNLAVFTETGTVVDVDTEAPWRVRPVETGRGYIVYENDREERFTVAALPERSVAPKAEETYRDAALRTLDTVTRKFSPETINILVTHLAVRPESAADGENESGLDCEVFPESCNYVALGGLHKSEVASLGQNVYYSGSIMPYSFEDSKGEKGVIVASVNSDREVRKEITKLKASKRLRRVRCASLQDAMNQLERYFDCLVDLSLSLPEPLTSADSRMLREKYPNLLQISLTVSGYRGGEGKRQVAHLNLPPRDLFKAFYQSKNSGPVPADLADLYLELTEERGE